eukprot:CAMPEP_0205811570 /NCGR_PEP_ID=MMETSP0205-20121125/15793_1 /ASSEMBLY_ACC=CAM_ASM_000278 /TAXON_ID=36767 /ORGANISM="Euplotes focardii, Strain TN1" /LENGTH=62 /DNA_ID=CAMNT_0053090919 /DNA_START=292 /DNA_END=480 /DNA_ORIENTATION=+
MLNKDWKKVKDINDIDFQLNYQKQSKKKAKDYYLEKQPSKSGGMKYFYYSIPDDPYETMVSF